MFSIPGRFLSEVDTSSNLEMDLIARETVVSKFSSFPFEEQILSVKEDFFFS